MLGVSMLVIFIIFPLILLTLYPLKNDFERLSCVQCKLTLKIFIDNFHGHYKDNMRLFVSLYLVMKFFNLPFLSALHYSLYFKSIIHMFVAPLVLMTRFQSYKCKKSDTIDTNIICAIIKLCGALINCIIGKYLCNLQDCPT